MTLLNVANRVYLGATQADRVYAGAVLVWPPDSGSWGPSESMYAPSAMPGTTGSNPNTFSVGTAFAAMVPGRITAIRYYRTAAMLASRNVSLWANDGSARLASVNATGGVIGWNTVPITPIIVTEPTAFRVVMGHYGSDAGDGWPYMDTSLTSATPHLRWDAGVYSDPLPSGGEDDYPNNITGIYNYFVDVVFQEALGPPPFAPTDIANLDTWLDASQLGLADNADVTSWPNLGSGPAVNIIGSPPMKHRTAILNGLPIVRFTANEARVRSPVWAGGVYDWTVIYVVRWRGPNAGRSFSVQYPPSNLLIGMHTGGKDIMYDNGTWIYGPSNSWADWAPGPGPWRIYAGDSANALGTRFYIDGALIGSAGGSGGFTNGWGLSGYDAASTPETIDIDVAELVIYARRLTDAERGQVHDYLTAKWGL